MRELRGRCSAIPPCCRRWFAEVWVPLDDRDVKEQQDPGRRQHVGWDWGYIPCPSCRHCGARIQVRACAHEVSGLLRLTRGNA